MSGLTEKIVFSGSMRRRSRAASPTRTVPDGWNETTDGSRRRLVLVLERDGDAVHDGRDDRVGRAEVDTDCVAHSGTGSERAHPELITHH